MKIYKTLLLTVAAIGLALPAQAAPLKIVTTTMDLKAIATAVGGDLVEVASIAKGNQDPHFIDAKPSFMVKLRAADLFVRVGLELEIGWEQLLLQGARNPKILPGGVGYLDASQAIKPLDVATGTFDRSQGDVHPLGNPHYWLDPLNGIAVAQAIAAKLQALDPDNKARYAANLASFRDLINARLNDPKNGWLAKLRPLAGTPILTFHKSWTYFFERFGLVSAGVLEPKPGIPPGPRHMADVIAKVRAQQVRLILVEPFYDDAAAALVAKETGAKVLRLSNSSENYVSLFDYLVNEIANAISQTRL